jgi:hypothetical protein
MTTKMSKILNNNRDKQQRNEQEKNDNEDVDIGPYTDSLLLRRLEYRGSLLGWDRNFS